MSSASSMPPWAHRHDLPSLPSSQARASAHRRAIIPTERALSETCTSIRNKCGGYLHFHLTRRSLMCSPTWPTMRRTVMSGKARAELSAVRDQGHRTPVPQRPAPNPPTGCAQALPLDIHERCLTQAATVAPALPCMLAILTKNSPPNANKQRPAIEQK